MRECPACGFSFQNPDEHCPRCRSAGENPPSARSFRRKTSKLAVAALAVSLLGPVVWFFAPETGTAWQRALPLYVILGLGLLLGLVASLWILAGRRRAAGLGLAVLAVLVSVLGLTVVAPLMYSISAATHQAECRSNLEQVVVALQMYAADYDALPPAATWSDRLRHYISPSAFVCPEAPNLRSGYALNRALASMSVAKFLRLRQLDRTVLLYESDLGWNGAGGPDTMTRRPRHRGQDTFAFADGQIEFRKRSQESDLIWQPAR